MIGASVRGRCRTDNSYAIAPKLIAELTSICHVTFRCLNLSKAFAKNERSLLQCIDVLVSPQHVSKVSTITLDTISVDSIFEAETFCKKFVQKLTNVEQIIIRRCQPMFLEKFFMFVTNASTAASADYENSTNLSSYNFSGRSHSQSLAKRKALGDSG